MAERYRGSLVGSARRRASMAAGACGGILLVLGVGAAPAQPPMRDMPGMAARAPCPAVPAPPPAALAGWTSRPPLAAAGDASGAAAMSLAIGRGATLGLRATGDIAYPVAPGHPGGAASHGGIVGFAVAESGTYRVALDADAWIDVVAEGKALASVAHAPGPACSGIRKTVDFALAPGRYLLEIASAEAATIGVLVARLP